MFHALCKQIFGVLPYKYRKDLFREFARIFNVEMHNVYNTRRPTLPQKIEQIIDVFYGLLETAAFRMIPKIIHEDDPDFNHVDDPDFIKSIVRMVEGETSGTGTKRRRKGRKSRKSRRLR
jgi:hypothetical protein